jgi:HSP20 family protein
MSDSTNAVTKDRTTQQVGPERTRGGSYFTPPVDIYETEKELLLFADMPGVKPDDIELKYERGELQLTGRVKKAERLGRVLYGEYEEGDYYRSFAIHESIDSDKIEASCKNGVVTVRLPKVERAQPRQIKVRAD